MTESNGFDKSRFEVAFKQYLEQARWHPHKEAFDLTRDGEYHYVSYFWQPFYVDSEPEAQSLLACGAAGLELVKRVHELSDRRIRSSLLSQTISKVIQERVTYPTPFTEEALQQCSDKAYSILRSHCEYQSEALVPLYNVDFPYSDKNEIELANAVLCSGHASSLLAEKLEHKIAEPFRDELQRCTFLRIKVSGDIENRRAQAEQETERALMVLRFATNWTTRADKLPKQFNRAHVVSQWPAELKTILFHNPEQPNSCGCVSHRQEHLTISKSYFEGARFSYGIDYLNYFFRNEAHPYSLRVRRALQHYDLGARSNTAWEALYQYVVCVNVALPTSAQYKEDLRNHLQILIDKCGYIGNHLKRSESTGDPESTDWNKAVQSTVEPFDRYYGLRGQLLHGNEMSYGEIDDSDVEAARELALNAVIAIAMLARELNWANYKDGKNWFDNPVSPPSMNLIVKFSAIERELEQFESAFPTECQRTKELLNMIRQEFGRATPEVAAVENWIGELEHCGQTLFSASRIPQWTINIREIVNEMQQRFDGLIQLRVPPV